MLFWLFLPLFLLTTNATLIRYRQLHEFPRAHLLPHNVNPIKNCFHIEKRQLSSENETSSTLLNEDNQIDQSRPILDYCIKETHFIESSDELNHLQLKCQELIGDLVIAPLFDSSIVDLGSISKIQGNLIIENSSGIVRINAINLNYITRDFILKSLTSLVTVEIPNLKLLNSIDWKVLPILNSVDINKEIIVNQNIIISDTSLSNINGFQRIKDIDIFNINNNRFLETIKTNLVTINKQLSIHANARDLELEMPMLKAAENITIRDTSYIWFPNLEIVSTSFEIIENLITILEVPNLKFIGGTLGIIENLQLNTANFNNVTEIQGGLMIAQNNELNKIDFFQNLKQIGGAIHFEGKFKDTNFENLKLVKGSAFIKSSSDSLDCNKWMASSNGRSIIRGGKVKCSSAKKFKFLNLDKEGKVLEKLEDDITHEGDYDSFDGINNEFDNVQPINGKYDKKSSGKKLNKYGPKSKQTNDSNSINGGKDLNMILLLSLCCLVLTHDIF